MYLPLDITENTPHLIRMFYCAVCPGVVVGSVGVVVGCAGIVVDSAGVVDCAGTVGVSLSQFTNNPIFSTINFIGTTVLPFIEHAGTSILDSTPFTYILLLSFVMKNSASKTSE